MRKILLLLLLLVSMLQAKAEIGGIHLFVNSMPQEIELKWVLDDYSSKYSYKIYRSEDGSNFKFIASVKPQSYDSLKRKGYSKDYIFMIYPNKNIKSFDEKLQILQREPNIQGFRTLKIMQDRVFAKNSGQYFKDTTVKKNKLYTYNVEAYKGNKVIYQRMIRAHTFSVKPKNDFLWVNVKNTPNGVTLTWDMQTKFGFFNIYRKMKNEKRFTKLNHDIIYLSRDFASNSKSFFTDTELKDGDKATYYICKVNMFSMEGKPSKKYTVVRAVHKLPKRVKNIFIKSNDKKITVRWRKSNNVLGYNIYRSDIYQSGFVKLNKKPIKREVYFDKNFKAGQNYYYYVTAVNMQGESKPSNKILAFAKDTTPPMKPKKLTFSVKAGEVSLKWSKVKDDDLLGYRIYTSMDIDADEWELINEKVIPVNSFVHKKPKSLSRFDYFYRVTAVDKNYNESFASNIIKVRLPDVTAPEQPFVSMYRAYTDKITLQWNKIMVYDLSHYNIYRKDKDKLIKLNKKPVINAIYTDKKPLEGINTYVITAVDTSGNESNTTKSKSITLIDNKPVKIEDFQLTRTSKGVKASFRCTDKDYDGFKLFKSSGKVLKYHNVSNFIKSKSFEDTQVSKHGVYFYMIKAYDKAGNISKSKVLMIKLD